MSNTAKIIILAAGKGTRLADSANPCPKVLRKACGRPLLSYVIDSTEPLGIPKSDITIVTGYMHECVEQAFADSGCRFALQGNDVYGTGYAVMCGLEQSGLGGFDGTVIVLQGDVPLVRGETLKAIYDFHLENRNACTLLSCESPLQLPFGRIVRENGRLTAIVEDKDCTAEQKKIRELNVGLYIFDAKKLSSALGRITTNNKAGEYYLTDVPAILLSDGEKVDAYMTRDPDELWGINTPQDLEAVEKILLSREKNK